MDDEDPESITDAADEEPAPEPRRLDFVDVILVVLLLIGGLWIGVVQPVLPFLMLIILVAIPLALLWFVWNVFLRRIWRARRIKIAGEHRELMDATMRGREPTDNSSETQR